MKVDLFFTEQLQWQNVKSNSTQKWKFTPQKFNKNFIDRLLVDLIGCSHGD